MLHCDSESFTADLGFCLGSWSQSRCFCVQNKFKAFLNSIVILAAFCEDGYYLKHICWQKTEHIYKATIILKTEIVSLKYLEGGKWKV